MNNTTAYWTRKKVDATHYHYFCSRCGCKSRYRKSIFCPSCGTRMIEGVANGK
ncbi:MAG: hypothetical protein IIY21_01055 [Clostridiales bacterium]|nr:hypothetical protein [Clostridiales bacterium]